MFYYEVKITFGWEGQSTINHLSVYKKKKQKLSLDLNGL